MHASDGTSSCSSAGGLCDPILQLWWWGNSSYVQGSLVAPFTVCLPLCLVSSFLFRSRPRVAPFFCLPSGCCRNTKSLCDWLMPGSFCWCRRRKKSLALFLRIPPLCFLMAPSSEALKELSDSSSPSGSCKAGPLQDAAGGSFSRSQESRSSSPGLRAGRAWAGSSSGGEVEEAAAASWGHRADGASPWLVLSIEAA